MTQQPSENIIQAEADSDVFSLSGLDFQHNRLSPEQKGGGAHRVAPPGPAPRRGRHDG